MVEPPYPCLRGVGGVGLHVAALSIESIQVVISEFGPV